MATTTSTTPSTGTVTTSTGLMTSSSAARAPSQGILQHGNPIIWSATDPIALFIIQASIIVIISRLLHWPLKKLRQPRVISEVIAGVLLGPSVMGRIPGFTAAIFPSANGALAPLTLVANLGLVFFLFLVGLEADLRFLGHNWKTAATVGTLGMVLPFGCGAAIAWGLYTEFRADSGLVPISFGTYLLFIAVAMSITAFPVLCRILIELKLLHTPVGIVVLSAGVANDVVGWILLALCVALVNASNGITALYVLLVAVAYTLTLCFAVRPAFLWLLKRTGAISNGPSQGIVTLTMMMVLVSAWFTDILGIHAIFGAFLMGLIIPHDGGFAIKITEKIEDFVSGLFVPIFFTLSGLNTNLGLLNDGITWGYVVAIIAIAFITKITGGAIAARLTGRRWRESFAIGVLMSCKGLVELIVLNIGYNARILSQRTFTMFVVMALVTTFATTPLVTWLYPPWYQQKLESWRRGDTDWNGQPLTDEKPDTDRNVSEVSKNTEINRMAVHLRLDTLPGVLALVALFARRNEADVEVKVHPSRRVEETSEPQPAKRTFQVQGIRLKEIGDRESSVMKMSNVDDEAQTDPILSTFRITLGQIVHVAVRGIVLQCLPESYASELLDCVDDTRVDMMLLSWSLSGNMSENQASLTTSPGERFGNYIFNQFMSKILNRSNHHKTAIFIDNGFGGRKSSVKPIPTRKSTLSLRETASHSVPSIPLQDQGHHIFLPFFGTQDDIAALHLVLQLVRDPSVTATIVHYHIADAISVATPHTTAQDHGKSSLPSTPALASHSTMIFQTMQQTLPAALSERVLFESMSVSSTESPLDVVLIKARSEVSQNPKNAGDLIVLGRNANSSPIRNTDKELEGSEAGKIMGAAAGAFLGSTEKLGASFLIVEAAGAEGEAA